jgi:hypothetical protein
MVQVGPYYGGGLGSYQDGWNIGDGSVSDGSDSTGRYCYGVSERYVTYLTSAPSIPSGAIITAVILYIRTRYGGTWTHENSYFKPALYVPGQSIALGNSVQVPTAWTTYEYTYLTNPCNGGAQWTQNDLNGLEIGAELCGYDGSHHADLSEAYYYVQYMFPSVAGGAQIIGLELL